MSSVSVVDRLETIGRELGIEPNRLWTMSLVELAQIRDARRMGAKWTRGEIARIVAEKDGDASLEVLKYLDERGPRVIAWGDETDPYAERETG
jgi:hypothetical protein